MVEEDDDLNHHPSERSFIHFSLVKTIHYLTTNKKESEAFIETSEKEPAIDLEIYLTRLPHDHGDNLMK